MDLSSMITLASNSKLESVNQTERNQLRASQSKCPAFHS